MPRDIGKALELWYRSAELGYALAYNNVGYSYEKGIGGVEVHMKKSNYFYELAAMGGNETARNNLGNNEYYAGNMDRALKHYMLAVGGGYADSLNVIKRMYTKGDATKEEYTRALKAYQVYLSEIKSPQRDEAAAFSKDLYRYY